MQDYTPFLRYPNTPTEAKSHAEHLTSASLRYAIHAAVAKLEDHHDLKGVLDVVRAIINLKPSKEPDHESA